MATTPLKTATRALSIATLTVTGFAAWLLCTQGTSSSDRKPESPAPPQISFADVTDPSTVGPSSASVEKTETASRRRLDADIRRPAKKPVTSDKPFFDDESQEAARPSHVAKRGAATGTSQPRIQPNLGKLSSRGIDSAARDEFAEELVGESQSNVPSKSTAQPSRSTAVFRPMEVQERAEAPRVDSQLSALQRKVEQLAQAQADQKTNDLQKTIDALEQQLRENKENTQFEKLRQLIELQKAGDATKDFDANKLLDAVKLLDAAKQLESKTEKPNEELKSESPDNEAPAPVPATSTKPGQMRLELLDGSHDRFEFIDFHDADISEALAMLGQLSGMNIMIGRGVTGRVPAANLQNVTAEQALDAITKSLGFVYERDQDFVFVWTASDAAARKQAARKSISKVYRPRYVSVKELQMLLTPMLTKPTGLIAVTRPAEMGLEESKTKVGGDSIAQTDALLIIDFPEVIAQIDLVIADIDVPPAQVVIEAMILSVKLEDSMKLGVNFALLNGNNKQLVTTGNGAQINSNVGYGDNSLLPVAGDFIAATAGLKYGFINGDLAGFVEALETLAETSVVASPSVRVLNKQRAELIIGQRLGYKTTTFNGTQSIENINFLEVGTKLLLRPFVAQDGLVRMEIHPERSDGTISDAGLPSSRTTEVTSNVMVRDGSTIVIGGLIEEQAHQAQSRVPLLGAVPIVGNLFKNRSQDTNRTELIVLITPRIIRDPEAECEGDVTRAENERRHQEYRDKLCPINRHSLAFYHYERAARCFEQGDLSRAKNHIDASLRENRTDKDSLRLRDEIVAAMNDKNWWKKLRRKPPTQYHNLPSAPTPLPPEAMFEQEFLIPSPSDQGSAPQIPALPAEPLPPPPRPSASRINARDGSRS